MDDKEFEFEVSGRGEFPAALLVRENANPASAEDQAEINARPGFDPDGLLGNDGAPRLRTVRLVSSTWHTPSTRLWEAHGWKVTRCDAKPWWVSLADDERFPPPARREPAAPPGNATPMGPGCVRKTFHLSEEAMRRLVAIRKATGEQSDAAVIERLLMKAHPDAPVIPHSNGLTAAPHHAAT